MKRRLTVVNYFDAPVTGFHGCYLTMVLEKDRVTWELDQPISRIPMRMEEAHQLMGSLDQMLDNLLRREERAEGDVENPFSEVEMIGDMVCVELAKTPSMVLGASALDRGMDSLSWVLEDDEDDED